MLTTAPRGTKDIMPSDVNAWRYLEETMRKICAQYGYKEIRTPVFEHTELFQRGIGDTTDVVEKEMYTFTDRGNRSITLREWTLTPRTRRRSLPSSRYFCSFPSHE